MPKPSKKQIISDVKAILSQYENSSDSDDREFVAVEEQKVKRVSKRASTRKTPRNPVPEEVLSPVKEKKVSNRKPMTEEQKQAFKERMRIGREEKRKREQAK